MVTTNPRWKFVAEIDIENPSSAEGYQAQIRIDWRPGIAKDFRDIRFKDIYNRPLGYWIESKTDFQRAVVWVVLPANANKILMLFGNGLVTDAGSITDVMGADIKAYFPFNGNANDLSGNGYNATVTGPTLTTDEDGNEDEAYNFDGSNDRLTIANVLQNLAEFTIVAKIKLDSTSGDRALVGAWGNANNILFYHDDPSGWRVIAYDAGSNLITTGYYYVSDTDWHKVAATYKKNDYLRGYVDDDYKSGGSTNNYNTKNTNSSLYIGTDDDVTRDLDGKISYIRIYSAQLTVAEMQKFDADNPPVLTIKGTRRNGNHVYIEPPTMDYISAGSTVVAEGRALIDKISAGDITHVTAAMTGFVEKISVQSSVSVLSNDKFVDKLNEGIFCEVTPTISSIKVFADIDNYNVENVSISKSINDAMWQLTATIDGTDSPAEFRHLNFSKEDNDGVTRHLFTGIIPDTRYTLQIAQNKIAITAFDYGWYLSAQYVPVNMLVMNLDGEYGSWDEWISALLDETGIIPYKFSTCNEVPGKEFVFDEKTTKQDAINEITKATGFIFSVQWTQVGNTYDPAAYFIDPVEVDDPIDGLDLPTAVTVDWPDDSLVDIPTLQGVTDEKINRVKVRGVNSSGTWYSASVESVAVTNGEDFPREYYFESADLDTQDKVNAKAAELYAYFSSDTYTVEATFIGRYDLQLYQKIRFAGDGFPAKLTNQGWFRIISISYISSAADDTVSIKAVVDRDVSLQQSEIDRYLLDNISESELIVDSKLDSLKTTPMIGTVQSIDGNVATILTEDGRTIKARIIIDS